MGGAGQRMGEVGGMDGVEAEKDKMLVEKQKVIEELTWKLHQEQRQVMICLKAFHLSSEVPQV